MINKHGSEYSFGRKLSPVRCIVDTSFLNSDCITMLADKYVKKYSSTDSLCAKKQLTGMPFSKYAMY